MAGISGYGKLPLRNKGVKSKEQIKEQPKVNGEVVKVKCLAQMVVGKNSGASYKYNSPEI